MPCKRMAGTWTDPVPGVTFQLRQSFSLLLSTASQCSYMHNYYSSPGIANLKSRDAYDLHHSGEGIGTSRSFTGSVWCQVCKQQVSLRSSRGHLVYGLSSLAGDSSFCRGHICNYLSFFCIGILTHAREGSASVWAAFHQPPPCLSLVGLPLRRELLVSSPALELCNRP